MNKKIIDERINGIELEISRVMYRILVVVIALSIFYKMFILNLNISNYIFETIALISVNIIEFLLYAKHGVLNDGTKKVFFIKIFKESVISTVIFSVLFFVVVGIEDYRKFLITIAVYIILYASIKVILNLYSGNKLNGINKEINDYDD